MKIFVLHPVQSIAGFLNCQSRLLCYYALIHTVMETEFRSLNECRPLMTAATPDLYQNNAFRITRLTVDASTRDITKHADKIKMMIELGHSQLGAGGIMSLQPPPTLHQVRAAVEMLKEPETRLIHELFWFWPEEFGNSRSDSAFHAWASGNGEAALRIWTLKESNPQAGAVARHNLAVFWHLAALDGERNVIPPLDPTQSATLEEYWRMSLKRWSALAADDVFWDRITTRIRQLDDPRLKTSFSQRMRGCLLEALGRIHVELALRHANTNDTSLALTHAQLMRKLISNPGRMAAGLEEAMAPVKTRLRDHARQVRKECEERPQAADALTSRLMESARPLLEILQFIHGGKENPECSEFFDEVAATCAQCASIPHAATDAKNVVPLLERARTLAVAPELIQHIDAGLALWNARGRLRPVCEQLDKVRASNLSPKSKLWRIRDHVLPQLGALLNADPHNAAAFETRSAVAGVLREIAYEAADHHEEWDTAFVALDLASQHACYEERSRQIWHDRSVIECKRQARQEVARVEARRQTIEKLVEKLDAIEADLASPRTLAYRVEQEIVPYIAAKIASDQKSEAQDCAAATLRRIALSAWEIYGDAATALNAITAAGSLASDSDLRSQLLAEKVRAEQRRKAQEEQNLALRIRDDQIEISGSGVRLNDVILPADEIVGVRFGRKTVDGSALDRTDCQIEIAASCARQVRIDCHRMLRGKARVAEDFEKITGALRFHIAPQIAGRITRTIGSTGSYLFSEADPGLFAEELAPGALGMFSNRGLMVTGDADGQSAGISLSELRHRVKEGCLVVLRPGCEIPVAQWPLGQVWNVVFFAEIVAAAQKQFYDMADS